MAIPSHRDLRAACLWAVATLVTVVVSDSVFLRTIVGAPMVLLVSGHAMLRALGIRTNSVSEHLTFAVGASLAVAIVGGFALNAIDFLTPLGWAIWLFTIAIGAALVADRRTDTPDLPTWPAPIRGNLRQGTAIALAVLLATGGYALAIRDEATHRQFRYTEFWMLPSIDNPGRLTVGVRSAETQTQRFDVDITIDGRPFAVFRSLILAPGETWTRQIPVPISADSQKAQARLYRPDDNRLYRSVSTLVSRI